MSNGWKELQKNPRSSNGYTSMDLFKLLHKREKEKKKKNIYATKNKIVIADAMSSIDILVPSVPQQSNGTECGFFVLYYIYHFVQNDPPSFILDDYPSFRKYDILAYLKEWVMKDLDQKWRSWKYELRNKYFNPTLKQMSKIPPDPIVNVEQWKRVVQTWSSNSWK
ncbi:hypothetical protein Taro_040923, partial [Colocasia esculenta]|nr:hypothetical protein [Colocasia esculenta]